jgi:hypothetical protein
VRPRLADLVGASEHYADEITSSVVVELLACRDIRDTTCRQSIKEVGLITHVARYPAEL